MPCMHPRTLAVHSKYLSDAKLLLQIRILLPAWLKRSFGKILVEDLDVKLHALLSGKTLGDLAKVVHLLFQCCKLVSPGWCYVLTYI